MIDGGCNDKDGVKMVGILVDTMIECDYFATWVVAEVVQGGLVKIYFQYLKTRDIK